MLQVRTIATAKGGLCRKVDVVLRMHRDLYDLLHM